MIRRSIERSAQLLVYGEVGHILEIEKWLRLKARSRRLNFEGGFKKRLDAPQIARSTTERKSHLLVYAEEHDRD